jgi:hypothetical protein
MVEWLGGRFDPLAFDVEETNKFLNMLKGRRTSESGLGSILEARFLASEAKRKRAHDA